MDQTPLSCCASRLLQFLFLELKTELKEFVPKGNYKNTIQKPKFKHSPYLKHLSDYDRSQNNCKNSF